jgi:hypothetical protein
MAFYDLMLNQSRPREAIDRYAGEDCRQHKGPARELLGRCGVHGVVPVAVPFVAGEGDGGELLVGDVAPGGVVGFPAKSCHSVYAAI